MKKILIVLGLILSINAVSYAKFSDVKNYTDEIDNLVSKGIINGYEDNTFKPENKITRAEIAKMIVTATGKTNKEESAFSDVVSDHWAKKFIDIAVANNYIKGDTEGTFRPDDNITYGEVATIMVRAMDKEKDVEKKELEWPLNYMQVAEDLKLFEGYKTNDLVAVNEARRDNVALMIYNMLNQAQKAEKQEEKTEEKSEEKVEEKIDTKTAYAGIVMVETIRRGENYLTLKNASGKEAQIKLASKHEMPEMNAFLIYKLNNKGEINIKTKLTKADVDGSFKKVTKVDGELVWLNGEEKILDLDMDECEIDGKTVKPKKYTYFIISSISTKSSTFKMVQLSGLKLKKNDKIKFDEKYNVCYIVR